MDVQNRSRPDLSLHKNTVKMQEILAAVILFYFHLNYAVASLLMLLPLKSSEPKKTPLVSIIITTRNEEAVIEKTLKSVKALDYPKFEIIVVDSSSDNTAKIARKYAHVIKDKKGIGKPYALNLGIKKARGEILYFLDADSIPEKNALKKLVAALQEKEVATGMNLVRNKQTFVARIARLQETFFNSIQIVSHYAAGTVMLTGKNFAIRKKTLMQLKGFGRVLAEDIDLSVRLYNSKKNVAFTDAKCFGQVPHRLDWYVKQQKRWMHGGSSEIAEFFKKPDLARILFWGPLGVALGFSYIFAVIFLVAYLFTGSWIFLTGLMMILLTYFISTARFLNIGDFLLVPVTLLLLGVLQIFIAINAAIMKLTGKEMRWEKTPKSRN